MSDPFVPIFIQYSSCEIRFSSKHFILLYLSIRHYNIIMMHDILQIFILSFFFTEFKVTELAVGISLGIVLVVITIAAVSYYKCRVYSYKMKYTEYDKVKNIFLYKSFL